MTWQRFIWGLRLNWAYFNHDEYDLDWYKDFINQYGEEPQ